MAERTPPSWLQGGSHTAENDRNLIAMLVASGGTLSAGDLAVAAPGGTMTVTVAAGAALIRGSRTFQGAYHCINDASVSKTIAASDPTNARFDRIVAEVKDAFYAGAVNAFQINVVQGTPSASPVEPAIPADSIELARVTVPAAASSISSGNILDRRALAVGSSSLFLTLPTAASLYIAKATPTLPLTSIQTKAVTDLPSTYPIGYTVMEVDGTWPSYGFVTTFVAGAVPTDAVQVFTGVLSNLAQTRRCAGGNSWSAWTPLGGGANPSTIGFVTPENTPSTAAALATNLTLYMRFRPLADVTVTALRFMASTASGNMDVGIYSESGGLPATRLVSAGSFAVPGAGVLQAKAITSTVLTGGTPYWLGFSVNNGTAQFYMAARNVATMADVVKQETVFPLPATATPVALASTGNIPMLYILT